jgi:hypothetical protein
MGRAGSQVPTLSLNIVLKLHQRLLARSNNYCGINSARSDLSIDDLIAIWGDEFLAPSWGQ